MEKHEHTNRLIHETSPYLLQHAHNPVDWYAWKEEAFERARTENKPILVSIGYSTCHWCHVMERESFENEQVAAFMNKYFINIKVDREERPDVDQIYMEASQILSGSGGWPLNCFLTPEAKPYFAGTYFPPTQMHNRPSWLQVLQNMANAFIHKREVVEEQAEKLLNYIKKSDENFIKDTLVADLVQTPFDEQLLKTIFDKLKGNFDTVEGGIGGAPKFPATMSLEYLLSYHFFTNEQEALDHVTFSLDKMIMGGIYDQIGGGFSRYATDRAWLIPHFEKMLYDNALLVTVLSNAYRVTQKELYKDTIEETLEWVEREMLNEEGGFYSALDADSEGVEGKFYVWDKQEIQDTLGSRAFDFNQFYGVTTEGNWEHKNILNRTQDFEAYAKSGDIDNWQAFKQTIKESGKKLLAKRAERIRPGLDDKILLDWNALQCTAYANAYAVLGIEKYKTIAEKNLQFIFKAFGKKDSLTLYHSYKEGQAQYDAFLNDYAFLIEALIEVYQINFDESLLEKAKKYTDFVIQHFLDEKDRFFFFTGADQKDIIIRKKDLYDSALPSGNSTMVRNLQRMSVFYGKELYKELAYDILLKIKDAVSRYPSSFSKWANAMSNIVYPINEIAIVGDDAKVKAQAINNLFIPNKVMMVSQQEKAEFPLLAGKETASNALIYLCKDYACQIPVQTIDEFRQLVR